MLELIREVIGFMPNMPDDAADFLARLEDLRHLI
jgi:hypothetical protein